MLSKNKKHPDYTIWSKMKARCLNPNLKDYKHYGGRGIVVCERWRNSFINFLNDMGNKPFSKAQIDRTNNNGNYEPENCKWVSCKENARNKRNNLMVAWNGENKTLSQWSELLNINKNTLRDRIYSKNWTIDESLSTPVFKKGQTRDRLKEK